MRTFALFLVFCSLGACVDARARFDEFGTRLPDAGPTVDAPQVESVPNIDGDWLLAVNPGFAAGSYIQFATSWDLSDDAQMLTGTYQPLTTFGLAPDAVERVPVGAALTAQTVVDATTATFEIHLVGILPDAANTVNASEYSMDVVLSGRILSTMLVCGTVRGTVGPVGVDGSTFAAVPSAAPLPAPLGACPATQDIDAGL